MVTLDPQVINSVFQGGALLLGALGTFLAVLTRRREVRARDDRRTRRRLQLALGYIDRLGDRLAARGLAIPSPPPGLYDEDDDDPGGTDATATA